MNGQRFIVTTSHSAALATVASENLPRTIRVSQERRFRTLSLWKGDSRRSRASERSSPSQAGLGSPGGADQPSAAGRARVAKLPSPRMGAVACGLATGTATATAALRPRSTSTPGPRCSRAPAQRCGFPAHSRFRRLRRRIRDHPPSAVMSSGGHGTRERLSERNKGAGARMQEQTNRNDGGEEERVREIEIDEEKRQMKSGEGSAGQERNEGTTTGDAAAVRQWQRQGL